MKTEELTNLLVKLTINKAKKEDKHPMDILEELAQLGRLWINLLI